MDGPAQGGMATSPSDVLQDYTYGYGNDELEEEAQRNKSTRTAPLAIARKGRSNGTRPGVGEYAEGDSPGLGPRSARDGGRGRYEDEDEDMR